MGRVLLDMAMTLDGFVAGPNDEDGGLHDWFFSPAGVEAVDESVRNTGAILVGRRTYDLGDRMNGFAHSPYRVEHFVLTHDLPERIARGEMKFTFVTEGIESAVERAKVAAGDRNVAVGGGASIAGQCLEAGLVDEIQVHLVPVVLGEGIRLFDLPGVGKIELEKTRVIDAPGVTHLMYRIVKGD
ncbi:dihydrofolate reductase [Rubrobacter tropicus]|uniref:Dihydrofolate reductase n=1 Tax=Rubrobacter tropicus TaxID=2653851 RepID=A0A6G8QE42_9ACTN|nr:dihydrofolate reductase family protein [Rubrobacter tropicus]QIN84671.1 dihydrofolate reductase [Rubrobacter tropicus]